PAGLSTPERRRAKERGAIAEGVFARRGLQPAALVFAQQASEDAALVELVFERETIRAGNRRAERAVLDAVRPWRPTADNRDAIVPARQIRDIDEVRRPPAVERKN